jgi:hypothetical protein
MKNNINGDGSAGEQAEKRLWVIDSMLGKICEHAASVSEGGSPARIARPSGNEADIEFTYGGIAVAIHAAIAWNPRSEAFEVSLESAYDSVVVVVEHPSWIMDACDWVSLMARHCAESEAMKAGKEWGDDGSI